MAGGGGGQKPGARPRGREARGAAAAPPPERAGGLEAVTAAPRAQRGQPPPGPAAQTGRKAAQRLARPRRSGSRRRLGRRGEPWGGGPGGEARARSPSGPRGAAPIPAPRPPAAAREPPRASPHVGPHGLAAPAPDWSPTGQSEVSVSCGRADWPPRASRGRGRGSLLFFLRLRGAPHPRSRLPGPPPGAGPGRGDVVGAQAAARRPSKMAARGARPCPRPRLVHRQEKDPPPDTRPARALTLPQPARSPSLGSGALAPSGLLGAVQRSAPEPSLRSGYT